MSNARSCLSYWFPRLQAADVPVPRTEIVKTNCELIELLDGKTPYGYKEFLGELTAACHRIGPAPWFLRTGQTSAKHQWRRTAFLAELNGLPSHVAELVEFSECCDFLGLPHNVWVVREMLPVEHIVTLEGYHGFPLVAEARVFVKDGQWVCSHPYWPSGAIEDGIRCDHAAPQATLRDPEKCMNCAVDAKRYYEIADISRDFEVIDLAKKVTLAFADDGAWSVDILSTKNGYYVTDMAVASNSYHEDGCPHKEELSSAAS
jgi:hypothetical protein